MPIDPELADELVATVRAFVVKDVLPVASDLEHADEYPTELVAQMRALGLFGATIPVEHGGLGLDVATYARIVEELAAGWMSLTGILNTHMIAATLIAQHGTADQRARWLPPMAAGRRAWRAVAVGARRGQRHEGAAVQGDTRRRRVRDRRHQDVGHQR